MMPNNMNMMNMNMMPNSMNMMNMNNMNMMNMMPNNMNMMNMNMMPNNMNMMNMNSMNMNNMNNMNMMNTMNMMNLMGMMNNMNNQNNNNQTPQNMEELNKKEFEKKMNLKNQIVDNEAFSREETFSKQLNALSDMATIGSITKEFIDYDKSHNPQKYLSTEDALNSKDSTYFVLGVLCDFLEKQGVTCAIEKKDQNQLSKEKLKEVDAFLQFLINGLTNLKKHDFHFDFGWDKNEVILSDTMEQTKFIEILKSNLCTNFGILKEDLIVTYPRRGSVLVTVIFNSEDFNNINLSILQNKFQNVPELNKLINIESTPILNGILLNPELLDHKGDNLNQRWGKGEKRGGRPYIPPLKWKGYGLRVVKKYDRGNDVWLDYKGKPGEWCVAYHGASQANNKNYNKMRDENDVNHPGEKVGEGVYCSPDPKVLDDNGGIVNINGKNYKIGFMLRVKPNKIRIAQSNQNYWVLNGNSEEIRPYRILIKEI